MPAVGHVEDGYRFKGGNPKDPQSWEPVQSVQMPETAADDPSTLEQLKRIGRQVGYETLGGSIGRTVGMGAGPLGSMVGLGLGTAGGYLLDRVMNPSDVPQQTPLQTGVSALNSGLAAPVGEAAGGWLADRFRGLLMRPSATTQARLQSFRDVGVRPLHPAVTGSEPQYWAYNAASQMPGGVGPANRYADDALAQARASVDSISGPRVGSEYGAGELLQRGAEANSARFFARANALREAYRRGVPAGLSVQPDDYADALVKFRSVLGDVQAKAYGQGKLVTRYNALVERYGILDQAGNLVGFKPMPWDEADTIRKLVGEEIGNLGKSKAVLDPDYLASLKGTYGAMTESMEQALGAANPATMKAWQTHKEYFRRGLEVVEATQKDILQKRPELLFKALESGRYSEARNILGKVPYQHRRAVVGEVVQRLGSVPPGAQDAASTVWSLDRFVTNLSKLTDEKTAGGQSMVLNLMFGPDKAARHSLEKLGEVASWLKEVKSVANVSRTAPTGAWQKALASGFGAGGVVLAYFDPEYAAMVLGGLGTGAAGARVLSKLWTNPAFIDAMAYGTRYGTAEVGKFVGRLSALTANATLDDEAKAYIGYVLDQLKEEPSGARQPSTR